MSMKEDPLMGPPVTGTEHVATLVELVHQGALDPMKIGDPEVREQVLKELETQV